MPPHFRQVYLEITNLCNLRCSFCPATERAPGFLSREDFLLALDRLRPYTDYLYFHLKGEPLLHPLLPELLTLAGERGFLVTLTTNGTLLEKLSGDLLAAPALRQVNLSLHSYGRETHGDASGYLAMAADYARRAAAVGKHTIFRVWTLDSAREAGEDQRELLRLLSREFPRRGDLAVQGRERSVALEPHIFVSFEEQFIWPSLDSPAIPGPGSCHGARRMLGVLLDGTVVPCCLDGEGKCPLGNLFRQEMEEILSSSVFREISQGFREHRVTQELCRRCRYRLRFGPGKGNLPGTDK